MKGSGRRWINFRFLNRVASRIFLRSWSGILIVHLAVTGRKAGCCTAFWRCTPVCWQILRAQPPKASAGILNLQQTPRRSARPGATVAVFEVTEGYNLPVAVPEGSLLVAQAEGEPVLYRTKWAFEAIPAKLCDVVWSGSKTDTVRAVFTGEVGERLRPFTLWKAAAPQRGQHAVDFFFEDVFTDEDGCRDLFLTAGLLLDGELLDSAVLADGSKFCWSIHAWRTRKMSQNGRQGTGFLQVQSMDISFVKWQEGGAS